ncbi:SDR family oxidoreductase [bacterium LRH843]|nr:SDR family oxidoreductase [bacterium LRH843]
MIIDRNQLQGKTIVITGASRGIGREIAKVLSPYSANLVLGSRNQDELLELAHSLSYSVYALPLDVTDETSVKSFVDEALRRYGKIDILINCAGFGHFSSFLETTTEDFDQMMTVNVKGTFLCSKYVGQAMAEEGEGHILNLASIAATTALPGCAGYSASKFGVLGLTKVMQAELRGKGIQVTAVLPGSVNSTFWDHMESTPDLSKAIPVESLAEHIAFLLCQPKGMYVDEVTIMPPLGIL